MHAGTTYSSRPHRPRLAARRASGLTYIEVVIAMVIIAIVALIAFPTMLSYFQLSDTAREENLASHDLMAATEDVLSTPFATLTTDYAHGQPIPKYAGLHLANESISVNYADPTADPLLITITARWNDARRHPREVSYRCARTR